MTDLEKIKKWIKTFPSHAIISDFQVDYTDKIPNNGGIFPSGLIEISRRRDILGNIIVNNQLNFGLYYVFEKSADDDAGATQNADRVMEFQSWVQEQSLLGLAPAFGDDPRKETIKAQNGVLYDTDVEGTAMYMVQLSVNFAKHIRSDSKWLI